jgi:hypothetical protein
MITEQPYTAGMVGATLGRAAVAVGRADLAWMRLHEARTTHASQLVHIATLLPMSLPSAKSPRELRQRAAAWVMLHAYHLD